MSSNYNKLADSNDDVEMKRVNFDIQEDDLEEQLFTHNSDLPKPSTNIKLW